MSVSFVSATSAGSLGTSQVISVPSGVAGGDLMLLVLMVKNAQTITGLSAWTADPGSPWTFNDGTSDWFVYLYTRTAASEPASYTVTPTSNTYIAVGISAYRGAGGYENLAEAARASAQTWSSPTISTSGASEILVEFIGASPTGAGNALSTTFGTHRLGVQADGGGTSEIALNDATEATAGSYGPFTWTNSGTFGPGTSQAIVVALAVTSASVPLAPPPRVVLQAVARSAFF